MKMVDYKLNINMGTWGMASLISLLCADVQAQELFQVWAVSQNVANDNQNTQKAVDKKK